MPSAVSHGVDWSAQHCGVRKADFATTLRLMPDLRAIFETFPEDHEDFAWDVKVHMLMPRQYPCIPNWHLDNVPRVNGVQQFDKTQPGLPMYLWLSGPPLTQFSGGYVEAGKWRMFTQNDSHRGSPAAEHGWRGFIRATHKDILAPQSGDDRLRRHTQVYLDAETYEW